VAFCRFAYDNRWPLSSGTLVASSAASGLPAAASQNPDRTYVWRSLNQTANETLTRDLGSSVACTVVAVANVRPKNAGAVKLYEGGTGSSPGSWNLVTTIAPQDQDTRVSIALFTATARHWRIEFENGVPAVADYAEVGYVFLGPSWEPTRHCVLPLNIQRPDPSVGRASVDGQESFTRRTKRYQGGFFFQNVNQGDFDTHLALERAVGRTTPFFFALDTSLGYQQWLMRLTSDLAVTRRTVPGRWDVSYQWKEAA
jgi:hypothetical protein